jgi:hypothetical protein
LAGLTLARLLALTRVLPFALLLLTLLLLALLLRRILIRVVVLLVHGFSPRLHAAAPLATTAEKTPAERL